MKRRKINVEISLTVIVINKLTVVLSIQLCEKVDRKKAATPKYTLTTNQNDEAAQIHTECIITTWSRSFMKHSYLRWLVIYLCECRNAWWSTYSVAKMECFQDSIATTNPLTLILMRPIRFISWVFIFSVSKQTNGNGCVYIVHTRRSVRMLSMQAVEFDSFSLFCAFILVFFFVCFSHYSQQLLANYVCRWCIFLVDVSKFLFLIFTFWVSSSFFWLTFSFSLSLCPFLLESSRRRFYKVWFFLIVFSLCLYVLVWYFSHVHSPEFIH